MSVSRPVTGFVRPNPPTLEDHLDLVASPEGSILDVASGAGEIDQGERWVPIMLISLALVYSCPACGYFVGEESFL